MSLVILNNVSKIYGTVHALANIDMSIERGEMVSIMGPSGSGKTTLLNIVGCLDNPTEGSVTIDEVETGTLDRRDLTLIRREKIGLIFQQFHLIPYLTSLENIMLAQYYHSMPDADEAMQALTRVGLRERAHHLPSQLSGGEQQRVCIARALINYPALILADEPTGNLDEENEKIVMEIFRELNREGHTLVIVTHDSEIGALAKRCIRLEHGRVAEVCRN